MAPHRSQPPGLPDCPFSRLSWLFLSGTSSSTSAVPRGHHVAGDRWPSRTLCHLLVNILLFFVPTLQIQEHVLKPSSSFHPGFGAF